MDVRAAAATGSREAAWGRASDARNARRRGGGESDTVPGREHAFPRLGMMNSGMVQPHPHCVQWERCSMLEERAALGDGSPLRDMRRAARASRHRSMHACKQAHLSMAIRITQ